MNQDDFKQFLPDPSAKKIAGDTARSHTQAKLEIARPQELFATWKGLFEAPFKGITTDGTPHTGLFTLNHDGAPVAQILQATQALLAQTNSQQRQAMKFPVDSSVWRSWQNTELYVEDYGLRLDETSEDIRQCVMNILRASLSAEGFEKYRNVMRLNGVLGELVGGPAVMSQWSYTFCLFGEPSMEQPWGWQLFGHHLCLHCLLVEGQMVLTPSFMGAEPSLLNTGPSAGLSLFQDEERGGLGLMRNLDKGQMAQAIVAHSMMGGDLPEGRRHFADNLHLGGAFQDNRIVPYEGLQASAMTKIQRRDLLDLASAYLSPLPTGPMEARLREVEKHLDETHFCWIGGTQEDSPFYYRIQSPVIFIEFDHHAGVFLTNPQPEKFHVHTLVRTPNGNDYGIDLLRLHYQNADHHKHHHHGTEHH